MISFAPILKRVVPGLFLLLALSSCENNTHNDLPQSFSLSRSPEEAGFNSERLDRIDSLLTYYTDNGILPNAVTFVARGGRIVHHKAFGYKDVDEKVLLKENDIFRIASQTKAITTVALLTLFEEGRFMLDDPVSKYIPEFKNMEVLVSFDESDTTFTTRPATKEITIRNLLNHTSGIHYGILRSGPESMMFAREGIPAVNSMDPITAEDVVKKIASMPLMFDPGERYLYGMNTDVAGHLIEVISGKKLDRFFKERIFDPLGMDETYFYLPDNKTSRLVNLYSIENGQLILHPNSTYRNFPVEGARMFLSGGAGLNGPIEDYAKFCQMILNRGKFNGNRILGRKTIDMMTTNQLGDLEYGDYGRQFGLGLDIWTEESIAMRPGSVGALRWGGMYYTKFRIDPQEDLFFLFYTNVQPWRGPNVHSKFQTLVYQALE